MPSAKYIFTTEIDGQLREAYRKLREFNNRKAIRGVGVKFGIPQHVILARARALGLSRTKEKPWTDKEERLLERCAGLHLAVIARRFAKAGYHRTETAIKLRITRSKLHETPNHYSASRVASFFGVHTTTVSQWIKAGHLNTAGKKGTERVHDSHLISRDDLREFVLNHPEEFHLQRITDQYFFIDLLAPNKLCAAYRRELAA